MVATTSQGASPSQAEQHVRAQGGGGPAQARVPPSANRVGVVFVHGIGSQKQGETLLQWSAPIVEVLTAWRGRARRAEILPNDAGPLDPVVTSELDYESPIPVLTVRVPATTIGTVTHMEREWLMTEAWWASKVEPPSLATMASWLGPRGGAGHIVDGILANPSGNPGLIRIARWMVLPFVTVFVGLILTLFALFRSISRLIPIDAVRDSAVLREFDTFLTGWFGDVRILLYDPVQSANIRAGLARTIEGLRGQGCGPIVLVAHSGGAMVSVLTLNDQVHENVRVDKLVTFGEGWNLALRLAPAPEAGALPSGMADRLRSGLLALRPNLRWHDYWASNDPAPAGKLLLDQLDPAAPAGQIVSSQVWNQRSLLGDHGTYWDNDEEFIIPVLRQIDDPTGDGSASRFYLVDVPPAAAAPGGPGADPAEAAPAGPLAAAAQPIAAVPAAPVGDPPEEPGERAARHRQRVAVLALWRQFCIIVGVVLISVAIAWAPGRLETIGQTVADWLIRIPGLKLFEGLFGWLRGLDLGTLPFVGLDIDEGLTALGVAILQGVVFMAILQLLFAPVRAFLAWPKGRPMFGAVLAAEIILAGALVLAAIAIAAAPEHDRLLGAGVIDWLPGVGVTAAILGLAGLASWVSESWKTPVATLVVGGTTAAIFVLGLVAAIVAIFKHPGVELAELAYAAIWIGFVVIHRIGVALWKLWDRRERQVAYGLTAAVEVDRWPAIVGAITLVMFTVSFSIFVAGLPLMMPAVLTVIALVTTVITLGLAGNVAKGTPDSVAAPGAVMSARSD